MLRLWEEDTPYFIVRSKRKAWWTGECMYIWMASFVYLVFIMIFPLLVLLPVVSFDQLWGSLLVDFINNGNKIDLISLPENLIKIIYPSVAQGANLSGGMDFFCIFRSYYLYDKFNLQPKYSWDYSGSVFRCSRRSCKLDWIWKCK